MKNKLFFVIAICFTSCYSSRDSMGRYWKATNVIHRVLAKKGINQTSCPIVKK